MITLIKNAKIYDGTGLEPYYGELLIEDERILAVEKHVREEIKPDRIIDLEGDSIAPGFIDSHSHNDWFAIKKDPLPYFAPFIKQGITSFVTGNCGLSAIGFEEGCENVDLLGGGLFFFKDTTGRYGSAGEFLDAVDGHAPCNIAVLAGHCSARTAVAGYQSSKLSEEQEQEMLAILEKSLQEGACGISLGMAYEPGIYADVEELKKVAALCTRYDKPLTVHLRALSKRSMAYPELLGRSHGLRALDEMYEVAKGSKLKLQVSHVIFVGSKSWGDEEEFTDIMDQMRMDGIDVMFDIYDELLGVSVITVILPPWYQAMTREQRNKPFTKFKLSLLIKATSLLLGFGFKDIQVAYVGEGNEQYEGKYIHDIAQEEKISDLDAYLKMCELSDFKGRVNQGRYTTKEIIEKQTKADNVLFMTDAWVEEKGVQNPAIYDCFPKFLQDSLRGKADTMPHMIRKMTGAAADRFGIRERGYLKEGYYADLTIFDELDLKNAACDRTSSFGISRVFINGREVLDQDGNLQEELLKTSGKAIRA